MKALVTELRKVLSKMEAALSVIPEAIFWTDAKGNLQWCNASFATLVGKIRVQLLGKPVWEVLPLESAGEALSRKKYPVTIVLQKETQHFGIFEYASSELTKTLEIHCFSILQDNDDPIVVGLINDLTDIQEDEVAKAQVLAMSSAKNAIAIAGPDGVPTWVNRSWERISIQQPDENQTPFFVNTETLTHQESEQSILKTLQKGTVWEGVTDYVLQAEKGSRHIELITATPVRNRIGSLTNIIIIKQDITQQKISEEALAKSEGKMRAILDEAVDAIITADAKGTIESANIAAQQMFGYEQVELIGSNVRMLTPPHVRENHDSYMKRYIDGAKPKIIGIGREAQAVNKDGVLFPIELSISEVKVGDSRHFTAIIRDISERKFWDAQLLELNEQLQKKQYKIQEALDSAGEIQRSLLPKGLPAFKTIDVAWQFIPSEQIGGDIVGIIPLDDTAGTLAFYIIDVAGHGVPSAMVCSSVVQALQKEAGIIYANGIIPPAKVLSTLDKHFPLERFGKHFTIFYGVIETATGRYSYSHGGHPLAYVSQADGTLKRLEVGGTLIGLGGVIPFEQGNGTLASGETLFIYTDGITELENERKEQFGEERLQQVLTASRNASPEELLNNVLQSTRKFTRLSPQDDITLLAITKR